MDNYSIGSVAVMLANSRSVSDSATMKAKIAFKKSRMLVPQKENPTPIREVGPLKTSLKLN
jgi:hypothetical protein